MSSCTFFGHRDCPESIKPKLRETLIDLIANHIIDEIHKCLVKHGVEDENNTIWDYPFTEIEHVVEQGLDVVLVDISGYGDGEWKTEYRWFEVPEDFSEEEKDE